jgi:F420-0:gamma-glutamyl ligase-like protein
MVAYHALALTTQYWMPGDDYVDIILTSLRGRIEDDDFVVVSEKALSTALNNIFDESHVSPGLTAKLLARFWMRIAWGYFLSRLCHFGPRLTARLREYPIVEGSRHKQLVINHAGLFQALLFGSEGGIDGSNLPYSFVSLPIEDAPKIAEEIRLQVWNKLKKRVSVIVTDTDKTYSFRNFHFTPRPKPYKGIHSVGGIVGYIIGRALKLKKRSTPLAVSGRRVSAEEALKISAFAEKARGPGSGATVWDMAARFNVNTSEVSWQMLTKIRHTPLVIIRRRGVALKCAEKG